MMSVMADKGNEQKKILKRNFQIGTTKEELRQKRKSGREQTTSGEKVECVNNVSGNRTNKVNLHTTRKRRQGLHKTILLILKFRLTK